MKMCRYINQHLTLVLPIISIYIPVIPTKIICNMWTRKDPRNILWADYCSCLSQVQSLSMRSCRPGSRTRWSSRCYQYRHSSTINHYCDTTWSYQDLRQYSWEDCGGKSRYHQAQNRCDYRSTMSIGYLSGSSPALLLIIRIFVIFWFVEQSTISTSSSSSTLRSSLTNWTTMEPKQSQLRWHRRSQFWHFIFCTEVIAIQRHFSWQGDWCHELWCAIRAKITTTMSIWNHSCSSFKVPWLGV